MLMLREKQQIMEIMHKNGYILDMTAIFVYL